MRTSSDDPLLAEKSGVALVPAGPAGRFPNLYSPPWAIPAKSKVRDEAWELAKFLSSPRQLLEDGLRRKRSKRRRSPPSTVPIRPPFPRRPARGRARKPGDRLRGAALRTLGIEACVVVGDAVNAALEGRANIDEALTRIHAGLTALAAPF